MNDNNQIIAKCGSGGQPHPHALPFKNPFWLAVEKEKKETIVLTSLSAVDGGRIEMI
jgi:hypothetical protein